MNCFVTESELRVLCNQVENNPNSFKGIKCKAEKQPLAFLQIRFQPGHSGQAAPTEHLVDALALGWQLLACPSPRAHIALLFKST